MSDKPLPLNSNMLLYSNLLPKIREVAREHGYAVGVHGSMVTDLDLMLMPWVEDVKPVHTCIVAIAKACGGFIPNGAAKWVGEKWVPADNPGAKPHDRWSYTIAFGGVVYLDISVIIPPSPALEKSCSDSHAPSNPSSHGPSAPGGVSPSSPSSSSSGAAGATGSSDSARRALADPECPRCGKVAKRIGASSPRWYCGTYGCPHGGEVYHLPPAAKGEGACCHTGSVTRHPDPSGNNDVLYTCDGCGTFLKREAWLNQPPKPDAGRAEGVKEVARPVGEDQVYDLVEAAMLDIWKGPGRMLIDQLGPKKAHEEHMRRRIYDSVLAGIMRGRDNPLPKDTPAPRPSPGEVADVVTEVGWSAARKIARAFNLGKASEPRIAALINRARQEWERAGVRADAP